MPCVLLQNEQITLNSIDHSCDDRRLSVAWSPYTQYQLAEAMS